VLSVEEAWFRSTPRSRYDELPLHSIEAKERIESALEESRGRISGPRGAATRLGIPRTTLEAKIKRLTINKYKYQSVCPAEEVSAPALTEARKP
jgi:formate hydrogenlyase transcriptional activator